MFDTGWHGSIFLRLCFCLRRGVEGVAVVMQYCNRGKEGSHCLIKERAVTLGVLGGMWKDQHLFICLFSQTIIGYLFCISNKLK